jgi:uncharacterized NAD-dependent epimerase/dehydratase family protein
MTIMSANQKTTKIELRAPYLIFIGDNNIRNYAKTGAGILHWRPELVAGQLRFEGNDLDMGVPTMTIEDAVEAGVRSVIIGVAPVGGAIGHDWVRALVEAARAGLDIVSGLHFRLDSFPDLAEAAAQSGARLIDVRVPPADLPIGTGIKRSGKRAMMVGTDCVVGKKFSALSLDKALRDAGVKSTFRATGQTGIMIAGEGIPIDAVVSDFVSGAAEMLSPDNDDDHWDIIEGQGSLFHPGYAAVSLGLLHGSQPDAIIVCHDATRTEIEGWPHFKLPSIEECMERNLLMGSLTNPSIACAGISVNASGLDAGQREAYLAEVSARTGLPCVDPVATGCGPIVEYIKNNF